MKTPHYLRFVQALVLAAAVPACAADEPAPPTTSAEHAAQTADPTAPSNAEGAPAPAPTHAAEANAAGPASTDAGVDSSLPFSSGPIVPPELPAALS